MKMYAIIVVCVVLSVVTGCATVPVAPLLEDTAAKTFAAPEGKAGVYVARNSIIGAAVLFQTMLDGKMVGGIAKDTYHWLVVDPGDHTLGVTSNENQDLKNFTAEAGQNYFFMVEPQMGWASARAKLVVIEPVEGQKVIAGCKLAQSMKY